MADHDEPTFGASELAEAARQMFEEWRYLAVNPRPITDPMPRWKYERLRELAEAPGAPEVIRALFDMAEPVDDLPTAMTVDELPDFSAIYDLITGEASEPIPEVDRDAIPDDWFDIADPNAAYKPCYDVSCPPLEEVTIRLAQPVIPPPWVRAALDRTERAWSDHLHRLHGIASNGRHRVTTRPALAGGFWTFEVLDEPPVIVETLCERCTERPDHG